MFGGWGEGTWVGGCRWVPLSLVYRYDASTSISTSIKTRNLFVNRCNTSISVILAYTYDAMMQAQAQENGTISILLFFSACVVASYV